MNISLIVAASLNNAIGKDNQLLWRLPDDLKFFKNTTWGFPVIMGRKTFESVNQPLPGRHNIVVTSNQHWKHESVEVAKNIEAAIELAKSKGCKLAFIIGGGEIYKQSMHLADTIYMTRVHTMLVGDTFFPKIDEHEWTLTFEKNHHKDEKHAHDFSFQVWERKQHQP